MKYSQAHCDKCQGGTSQWIEKARTSTVKYMIPIGRYAISIQMVQLWDEMESELRANDLSKRKHLPM